MKILFASVPQWYPVSPYLACALLAGQVRAAGYQADTYDFNAVFFNDILTPAYLRGALDRARGFLASPSLACEDPAFAEKLSDTAAVRKNVVRVFSYCYPPKLTI